MNNDYETIINLLLFVLFAHLKISISSKKKFYYMEDKITFLFLCNVNAVIIAFFITLLT